MTHVVDALSITSRWFHLAAVIVALGGAVFTRWVLIPAAHAVLDEPAHERLREAIRARWRRLVHVCIAIILLSGLINLHQAARAGKATGYYLLFAGKLLAALAVFFLASALVGRSPAFAAVRTQSRRWLSLIIVLAAVIVLLSGLLRASG